MVLSVTSRCQLAAAALVASACTSEPQASSEAPAFDVSGLITHEGNPLSQATVLANVEDATGSSLGEKAAVTGSDGRFQIHLELDTLLSDGYYSVEVTPTIGSGIGGAFGVEPISFDDKGRADTSLTIALQQLEPPIAEGPPQPLDPGRLVGHYSGQTVEPVVTATAFLDLDFDSVVAGRPFGSFVLSFTNTTGCGGGVNSLEGMLATDTMYLRLRADFDPSVPDPPLQDFVVTSYDVANDTLIVRYTTDGANDCPFGQPAPVRVVRQGGP
jgi:hypothetical protein